MLTRDEVDTDKGRFAGMAISLMKLMCGVAVVLSVVYTFPHKI
jgi:hypothetical protein